MQKRSSNAGRDTTILLRSNLMKGWRLMPFRNESDLVRAINEARDLTNLVVAYLEIYRRRANGINGVKIPSEEYTVIFQQMQEGFARVMLVYTKTQTWQEPVYYDVDDDNFQESFGASNVSHYHTRSSSQIEEKVILIPFAHLLLPKTEMERVLQKQADEHAVRLQEAKTQARILELEAELKTLRGEQ